jgi:hypothetical protein
MLRRALAIMISGMLWSSVLGYQPARAQVKEAARAATAVRTAVAKLGVGSKARVEVKLQDGTKLRGSVSSAAEDNFTITDSKTGASTTVAYTEVAQVKEPRMGFWARTLAIAVVVGLVTAAGALEDGVEY